MKESEEMHLKSTINESTLSTADAVSLPHAGNAVKLSGRTFLAPHRGNVVKLSKILIAHASNSVCFFHPLSLLVNNKIKKLVK